MLIVSVIVTLAGYFMYQGTLGEPTREASIPWLHGTMEVNLRD